MQSDSLTLFPDRIPDSETAPFQIEGLPLRYPDLFHPAPLLHFDQHAVEETRLRDLYSCHARDRPDRVFRLRNLGHEHFFVDPERPEPASLPRVLPSQQSPPGRLAARFGLGA